MGIIDNTNLDHIRNGEIQSFCGASSVIVIKYKDGVMAIADTLGSYFSSARFTDVRRIKRIGSSALIAASGDIADFQFIAAKLKSKIKKDIRQDDGFALSPKELFNSASVMMLEKRMDFKPLLNTIVVAGFQDGKSFIGTVDQLGTSYEEDFVATGFGLHMAVPILREEWRPNLTAEEAKNLLEKCARILFYRDSRAMNRFVIAQLILRNDEAECEYHCSKPFSLKTKWDFKGFKEEEYND
ncbi:hypothetical protein MHBO_003908 [Bonamia ostreae]|uniref:Proteasome subunit beta n=1 Tax=Bonamia ostreae TaxID=126728 RepID=A0ABV2ARV8_9EUKA